jgi:23S rRNA (cytosine1962-C5)-methyltransferase
MNRNHAVVLKPGRQKPVQQGHPWVFSGAIRTIPEAVADGDMVDVHSHDGQWLARGYLNRRSQIQVRLLTWQRDEQIDADFWQRKLAAAIESRGLIIDPQQTDAYRLVNGESDFLPGLVVDRFGDYLVMQAGTLTIDQLKVPLAEMLLKQTGCKGVIERSDMALRREEGLDESVGLLAGESPPSNVEIREAGLRFYVDLLGGQKTGFYVDQRTNRQRTAGYCQGRRVLNAFAYTGAFAVHALAAGATEVVNLDSSVEALTLGEENMRLNGFDPDAQQSVAGDVFEVLRDWWEFEDERFDLIVLDPPKFANARRQVDAALRGYKDINLLALRLLRPGGILVTFSCSGLIEADLFQKVVFGAAVDAGRQVQILEWLRQAPDHPVAITFPEGAYLKGLICRVG